MLQIDFNINYNGKLLADHFPDIRAFNPQIHFIGNRFQAMYKSITLGVVEIRAVRQFPYARITDVCSLLTTGKPAGYQAKLIDRYYNHGLPCKGDYPLVHIVFNWYDRDMTAQSQLLHEWWQEKKVAQH